MCCEGHPAYWLLNSITKNPGSGQCPISSCGKARISATGVLNIQRYLTLISTLAVDRAQLLSQVKVERMLGNTAPCAGFCSPSVTTPGKSGSLETCNEWALVKWLGSRQSLYTDGLQQSAHHSEFHHGFWQGWRPHKWQGLTCIS